jgi:hypothetical protein
VARRRPRAENNQEQLIGADLWMGRADKLHGFSKPTKGRLFADGVRTPCRARTDLLFVDDTTPGRWPTHRGGARAGAVPHRRPVGWVGRHDRARAGHRGADTGAITEALPDIQTRPGAGLPAARADRSRRVVRPIRDAVTQARTELDDRADLRRAPWPEPSPRSSGRTDLADTY